MDQIIVTIINWTVVPVTSAIPFLASRGILLAVFGALWVLFSVALVRNRPSLDAAWTRIRHLPLVAQAAAWLLFLPVLAGLWIWRSRWPLVSRLALIAGLAGWNLLVFLPQSA
jgi:hypothetical protein